MRKCSLCNYGLKDNDDWIADENGVHHITCPSGASEASPARMTESATGSAGARATDGPGADSSGRSAEASGPAALVLKWRRCEERWSLAWGIAHDEKSRIRAMTNARVYGVCATELEKAIRSDAHPAAGERALRRNGELSRAATNENKISKSCG